MMLTGMQVRRIAACLLLVVCAAVAVPAAGGTGVAEAHPALDSSRVELRTPGPDVLQRYRSDDAYDYTESGSGEDPGLLDLFFRSVSDFLEWVFATDERETLAKITFYGLIAFIVGYGLLRIIRMERYSATQRRDRTSGTDLEGIEERVDRVDFDPLIKEAEEREAFREAIRLRYLKVLQHLDRIGAIEWAPQKTNRTYRLEVRDTPLLGDFDEATDIFEIVWYGDVEIDARDYDRLRPPFGRLLDASSQSSRTSAEDASQPSPDDDSRPGSNVVANEAADATGPNPSSSDPSNSNPSSSNASSATPRGESG